MYEIYCRLRDEKRLPNGKKCKDSNVSKATGIPPSTFSDWKNGRSRPKDEKLMKIANYFGVSLDYILGLDKTAIPIDATSGLSPEYINIMVEARNEGFTPEDMRLALDMLRMARKK